MQRDIRKLGQEEAEDWIISYADLVTVLLCFFILFFSETIDSSSDEVIEAIAKVFTIEASAADSPVKEGSSHQISRDEARMLASIESGIERQAFGLEEFSLKYGIERKRRELLIRIWEQNFFELGGWQLTKNGREVLHRIAGQLLPYNAKVHIVIEAHTDSIPPRKNEHYLNNVSLSALRASTAMNVFLEQDFDEQYLSVAGLGSSKVLHKDIDENGNYLFENAALNRRVEIRVLPLEF